MRQKLGSIGVALPPGKRKTSELTLLTALVEGEAKHLATDFNRVTQRDFPSTELAQHIANKQMENCSNSDSLRCKIRAVKVAKSLIKEIQSAMQKGVTQNDWAPSSSDSLTQGLSRYSNLTHTFGPMALDSGIQTLLTCMDNIQAIYEGHGENMGRLGGVHHRKQCIEQQPQMVKTTGMGALLWYYLCNGVYY